MRSLGSRMPSLKPDAVKPSFGRKGEIVFLVMSAFAQSAHAVLFCCVLPFPLEG